jgi:hypothetical protein
MDKKAQINSSIEENAKDIFNNSNAKSNRSLIISFLLLAGGFGCISIYSLMATHDPYWLFHVDTQGEFIVYFTVEYTLLPLVGHLAMSVHEARQHQNQPNDADGHVRAVSCACHSRQKALGAGSTL